MKPRLTAAAGLGSAVVAIVVLVLVSGGNGNAQIVHTCSATDKQFISEAQLNMAALSSESEDFLHGNAKASEVISTDKMALQSIRGTGPSDPSLSKTRAILSAMFVEYGKAIRADQHHADPGKYIYRAYGLANFAHDILTQAATPLKQHGCDITGLL
jgi:hypothetical protein